MYSSPRNNPVTQSEDDHDVFGDGTVTIKPTLGHTPGHQALFLKDNHAQPWIQHDLEQNAGIRHAPAYHD